MNTQTLLQLFLLTDIFILGILIALAVRHAKAHFRPEKHDADVRHATEQSGHLPPAVRQRVLEAAEKQFTKVLETSSQQLQHDLLATSERINKLLDSEGAKAVTKELEHYKEQLAALGAEASESMAGVEQEIASYKASLKAQVEQELAGEKERLQQQLDTKLADAVASFLAETMQHEIDLGAQMPYLTAQLEAHKAEFKQGVQDEA